MCVCVKSVTACVGCLCASEKCMYETKREKEREIDREREREREIERDRER